MNNVKVEPLDHDSLTDFHIIRIKKEYMCRWCKRAFACKKNRDKHYCRILTGDFKWMHEGY